VDPGTEFSVGWLCPLYKKGERTEISNYRPITILNTDYKIMTRALTTRISSVVLNLIHPDQAGFMKGRKIEDQTELVQLMLNRCEAFEENGVIVCLDQEKAYDKVRHDFIWKTLQKFGFPGHFIIAVCNNPGTASFLGQNQNLRILECPSREPHISGSSCPTAIIIGDLEFYYVGLHEYVYILRNRDIFLR
jgi:Reverse transcriptase (RNA-dependent DNA polymerase)